MPYTISTPNLSTELAQLRAQVRALEGVSPVTVCTTATRPTVPYAGQIIYDTTTGKWHGWNGSAWSTGITF